MTSRRIVLDANILVRAVLGTRVRELIEQYGQEVAFGACETSGCSAAAIDSDFGALNTTPRTAATLAGPRPAVRAFPSIRL